MLFGGSYSGVCLCVSVVEPFVSCISGANLLLLLTPPNLFPNNGVCSVGCVIVYPGCVVFLFLNLVAIFFPIAPPAIPPITPLAIFPAGEFPNDGSYIVEGN